MRVNDVFCAVSLSGTMWSALLGLLEKTPWATRHALSLRTQALPIFSNIQRLPVHFVIHAG